jgi:hypothetical protein
MAKRWQGQSAQTEALRQSAQANLKGGVVWKRYGQAPAGSEASRQKHFRQNVQAKLKGGCATDAEFWAVQQLVTIPGLLHSIKMQDWITRNNLHQ